MQPFTIRPACRRETNVKVWDSSTATWKTRLLKTPRIIQNPPQEITKQQAAAVTRHAALLAESIRLSNEIRTNQRALKRAGPLDFIHAHYVLLQREGLAEIEDAHATKQAISYAWDVVDKYTAKRITWERFKDEIENWYLLLSGKLESRRAPKRVSVGA